MITYSLSKKPVAKEKKWLLQSVTLDHRNTIISTLIPLPRYKAFIHKVLFENKLVDFVVTVALCPFCDVSKWSKEWIIWSRCNFSSVVLQSPPSKSSSIIRKYAFLEYLLLVSVLLRTNVDKIKFQTWSGFKGIVVNYIFHLSAKLPNRSSDILQARLWL